MNWEPELQQVRQEYLRRLTVDTLDETALCDILAHIAAHPGKMLRPRLLLSAAATLGDDVLASRRTLLLAVCVEMLHNASLLHDDIIDRDDTRRGQPSVNALWGNAKAVLAGDWLLAQIMRLLDEVDDRSATRIVNDTVIAMVQAELLAQENSGKLDQPTYMRIIDGKTARLFATACALGNPLYEDFGLHYGRLFQMRDDIADGEAPDFVQQLIDREQQEINNMKYKLTI